MVDNAPMQITALNPDADPRIFTVLVAGPGALLVAKAHKLWERRSTPHRLYDKDAHDVYRLLRACRTDGLAEVLLRILADPVTTGSCEDALTYIGDLFARGPDAVGAMMAGRAETGVGDPAVVAASAAILAQDLLADIARRRTPRPPDATAHATD